jgi:hypothetical protein
MAIIDKAGLQELETNIKNPLTNLWNKIEKAGIANDCLEEYDFIFKYLSNIESNWQRPDQNTTDPSVIINGKVFVAQGNR